MGVPKFYRWISERYPKINQVITDSALLPEFDHLYLDMNGIIHGCTHPSHLDVSDVLSTRDMMLGIMHYLDRIITQIVKPKVSVFMAIDGVAPRAKLNQQRSRRFRSAKDMAEAAAAAAKQGKLKKPLNSDDNQTESAHSGSGVFDSNCITPGTEFLTRVSQTIQFFIRKKIKEDPLWRNLKIVFSGPDIPGEGEHKIMQHIREMRAQPGYQPNTRHCMYGQDADLIMLGLVSHEPHFTLLREIVDFSGGFNRNANALKTVSKFTKESDFQLLHLSILREYLYLEFNNYQLPSAGGKNTDKSSFDLERIIDDFVFMTFLVGNDFLPHLPSMDISDGAFDLLFNTYKDQRKTWPEGEYLTNTGDITDPARLEAFLVVIGDAENQILEDRKESDAEYLKKKRKWDKRDGKAEGPSDEELANAEALKQNDYLSMIQNMLQKHSSSGNFVDGWSPDTVKGDSIDLKGRYYYEKLALTPVDIENHLKLRQAYIEGLIWCLAYYYRGCISWGWFYPYHYGPMLSDLTNLPGVFQNIKFEIGTPLKPFEQLMGCLPPESSILLPKPFRKLMTDPDSPIIEFYPQSFEIDMNGKRNPWEGVNLLSFINEKLLKDTISKYCPDSILTPDERFRNSIGKVYVYSYDPAINDTVSSINRDIGLLDIPKCNSRVDTLDPHDNTEIPFQPILIEGTKIPFPGFPSLNVLPMNSVELVEIGLNCFGSASKYASTILSLHSLPQLPPADKLADNILGKTIFINWPMMHEAKVVAVSDCVSEVRMIKKKKKIKTFSEKEAEQWNTSTATMIQHYLKGCGIPGSGGVQIGDVQIRLKVLPLQGMKKSASNGSTKKVFGKEEADVPLQMSLFQAPAPDPRFVERGPLKLRDRFPANSNVILTKGKYRGCRGTVMEIIDDKVGIRVSVFPPEPPFGLAIARSVQESYLSSYDTSRVLKMTPGILGKITGSLFFKPGRYDLGLNLKYKQDLCVLGYTRRIPKFAKSKKNDFGKKKNVWTVGDSLLVVGNHRLNDTQEKSVDEKFIWEYTPKAIRLVNAYRQKFPQLFTAITKNPNESSYDASILGSNGVEMLAKIREWLNNVETAKLPRMPGTTEAMPYSAISAVQRAADVRVASLKKSKMKEINLKVPSSAFYMEGSTAATNVLQASDLNDNPAPELGDRVINLCANGIPFGARGTVVSLHDPKTGCVEVVMDEEFIGGSTLQGSCGNFRGKLCVWNHLMKITAKESKDIVEQILPAGYGKSVIKNMMGDEEMMQSATHEKENPSETKVLLKPKDNKNKKKNESNLSEEDQFTSNSKPKDNDHDTVKEISRKVKDINLRYTNNNTEKNVSTNILSSPKVQMSNKEIKVERKFASARSLTPNSSTRGGGKQGAWKEAKGPGDTGIGFKQKRSVESGLKAWRSMVSPKSSTETNSKVTQGKKGKSSNPKSVSSASAGLKAMLGVSSVASPQHSPMVKTEDASAGLKAMLGVNSSGTAYVGQPDVATPPPPSTAADVLLQMMAKNHNSAPQPYASIPTHLMSPPSKFNFSYVKDSQQPDEPINQPVFPIHSYTPNMPYSIVPQVHGTNYNPGMMPSHMMMANPGPLMGHASSNGTALPTVPAVPVVSKREKRSKKIDSDSNGSFLVPSVAISSKK